MYQQLCRQTNLSKHTRSLCVAKMQFSVIEKYLEVWTPGAEWPAEQSMWLYLPSDAAADPDPLGDDRFVSL
jgi:hypothetical protein